MKTTLCFVIILLTFVTLAFVPNSFAQTTEPHNIVRLIYFVPSNRTPEPNINAKFDKLIKEVQTYFAAEMERHGFGRKTFVFEADNGGNAIVHSINGNFPDSHYHIGAVIDEVSPRFDFSNNIYFIVADVSHELRGNFCGYGGETNDNWNEAGDRGGWISMAAGVCFTGDEIFTVAHELGHAFGLFHDFSNDNYLMSYGDFTGKFTHELSQCSAEWFNVNRYFNNRQTPPNRGETRIEMLPPTVSPTEGVRFRFRVSDPDGLQIAHLITPEFHESIGGLVGCQNLTGESQLVEFVTTELTTQTQWVTLRILDSVDNLADKRFPIDPTNFFTSDVVPIPDRNLALAIRDALGLESRKTIMKLDLLALKRLYAYDVQITDLTGLEHARNLKYLYLRSDQISDFTPIMELSNLLTLVLSNSSRTRKPIDDVNFVTGLTQLWRLELRGYQFHDLTPFAGLTNLRYLGLGNNLINDVTPPAGLANLGGLYLGSNQISDITPLAELTNLHWLWLDLNQINDISPLAELTNLQTLRLNNNHQISDITPLAGLINLSNLYLQANRISDVSPLVKLRNLYWLYLADNPIEDFSPLRILLANNPYLKIDIDIPDPSPLAFSPGTIADQTFTVGEAVNLTLPVATSGTPPYAYTLAPLPEGLSFNSVGRILSGTPTTAGTTNATYTATDAANVSASLTFTIEVTEGVILDVNGDGQVTVLDLAIVALFYGTQVPADISLPADVNADSVVNVLDLTAVAQGIDAASDGNGLSLQGVEAALLAAAAQAAELEGIAEAPMRFGRFQNVADALADVKHLSAGDVRLGRGVIVLKELLHLLTEMAEVPEATALLPNYPNPFNPETWIPYHLATDAEVILTIYDTRGVAVRTLVLGHQPAGVYQSKHRAAYWDGKNDAGEKVASGLYFYTLTAGDFTATRKLLIVK